MARSRDLLALVVAAPCLAFGVGADAQAAAAATQDKQVVPFVVTPDPVASVMARLATERHAKLVYDLGCGDGQLALAAARLGARAVGIDIEADLVTKSQENAKAAGLADRTTFLRQDLFESDLRPADAVVMYLLFTVNLRLRPKLIRELRPGVRIVSHTFSMGDDWPHDGVREMQADDKKHKAYFWDVPAPVGGHWRTAAPPQVELQLRQVFQTLTGSVTIEGQALPILQGRLSAGTAIDLDAGDLVKGTSWSLSGQLADGELFLQGAAKGAASPSRAWRLKRTSEARLEGVWRWVVPDGVNEGLPQLTIRRDADGWRADLTLGAVTRPLPDFYVWGDSLFFTLPSRDNEQIAEAYEATVEGGLLKGTHRHGARAKEPWQAMR
jgi:SAM-dependent methyltransferase